MPVLLISSDNKLFRVEKAVAQRSTLIRNILEEREDTEYPIPLPNIPSPVLKKVLEYCKHHQADPLPTIQVDGGSRRRTDISGWDRQFINTDQGMLFDILLAAWHLDIESLVDVGCQTLANQMKGKSPEELRKFFNLANDFTPEEEAQIRKEKEWANDR